MNKIRVVVLMSFIAMPLSVFSRSPGAQVRISSEKPYILPGEMFTVDVQMTNTGTTDLHPILSMACQFDEQWVIDNPGIGYNRMPPPSVCPDRSLPNGSIPASARHVVLKPGHDHGDKMDFYLQGADLRAPLTWRLGYKEEPDSEISWSNIISIPIKLDEKLDVTIDASSEKKSLKASERLIVSVRIRNDSRHPVNIGTEICGEHGIIHWKTDAPFVHAAGGSVGCRSNLNPDVKIVLKPGEIYKENLAVSFKEGAVTPGPLTFRVGLQNVGYQVAWSNPLTVEILPQ